jgi:hypothetical protein
MVGRLSIPFISFNLSLDLVRFGLQLVAERLNFICPLALSFCQAKTTLCLSHEVLDAFLNEHLGPCRSIPTEMPAGLSATDARGKAFIGGTLTYVRGAQIANPAGSVKFLSRGGGRTYGVHIQLIDG